MSYTLKGTLPFEIKISNLLRFIQCVHVGSISETMVTQRDSVELEHSLSLVTAGPNTRPGSVSAACDQTSHKTDCTL